MTFCIDFDGTLTEPSPYPITGALIPERIEYVKRLKSQGHTIILHTARKWEDLDEAVKLCAEQGLVFDEVHGGKPRADKYVDDKAIAPEIFFSGL